MTEDRIPRAPTEEEERRDKTERRTEDRRAHDRYTPVDGVRIDRRQTERRREPD